MNFLGCDGVWLLQEDGSTVCQGELKTYTVQEMRDYLTPAMSMEQKALMTSAIVGLMAFVWTIKYVQRVF